MTFALPQHVDLLTRRITVEEVPNLHVPAEESEDGHVHRANGVYDPSEHLLTLDADLPFELQRLTFLHENLHAILGVVMADDEETVARATPVMLAWMRSNPHVIAYLMETQK